jgi:pilus assembly protein CpaB
MHRGALMLACAVVLGLLSVLLARNWLEHQVRPSHTADMVTVVVAKRAINYGDEIQREYLMEVPWPAAVQPQDSFAKIGDLLDGKQKRLALHAIQSNEPVLKSKVSGFGQRATLSTLIDDGRRAVTIRVNDVIGVAGFVLPGDRVDVLLTRQIENNKDFQTDVILQKVKVLGIDQEASDSKEKPTVARAVTLEVTPEESQKLALASQVGSLTLALRNGVGSEDPATLVSVRTRDLSKAAKAVAAARNDVATVTVVRALKATDAEVSAERTSRSSPSSQ